MVVLFQTGTGTLKEKPKETVNYESKLVSLANNYITNEPLRNWVLGKISEIKGTEKKEHLGNTETLYKAGAVLIMCASQLVDESPENIKKFVLAAENDISNMLKKTPPDMGRFASDLNRSRAGEKLTFTGNVTLAEQVPQKVERPSPQLDEDKTISEEAKMTGEQLKLLEEITKRWAEFTAYVKNGEVVFSEKKFEEYDDKFKGIREDLIKQKNALEAETKADFEKKDGIIDQQLHTNQEQLKTMNENLKLLDCAISYVHQASQILSLLRQAQTPSSNFVAADDAGKLLDAMVSNPQKFGLKEGTLEYESLRSMNESLKSGSLRKDIEEAKKKNDTDFFGRLLDRVKLATSKGFPTYVYAALDTDTYQTTTVEAPKNIKMSPAETFSGSSNTTFTLSHKPVKGTLTLDVKYTGTSGYTPKTEGTDFTVDYDTGIITWIGSNLPTNAGDSIRVNYYYTKPGGTTRETITTAKTRNIDALFGSPNSWTGSLHWTQAWGSTETTKKREIGNKYLQQFLGSQFDGSKSVTLLYTPVRGTVELLVGEEKKTEGTDFTVDYENKKITWLGETLPSSINVYYYYSETKEKYAPSSVNVIWAKNPKRDGVSLTRLEYNSKDGEYGFDHTTHVGTEGIWIYKGGETHSRLAYDNPTLRKQIASMNTWGTTDFGAGAFSVYGKYTEYTKEKGRVPDHMVGFQISKTGRTMKETDEIALGRMDDQIDGMIDEKQWGKLRGEISKFSNEGDLYGLNYIKNMLQSARSDDPTITSCFSDDKTDDKKEIQSILDNVTVLCQRAGYDQDMLKTTTLASGQSEPGVIVQVGILKSEIQNKISNDDTKGVTAVLDGLIGYDPAIQIGIYDWLDKDLETISKNSDLTSEVRVLVEKFKNEQGSIQPSLISEEKIASQFIDEAKRNTKKFLNYDASGNCVIKQDASGEWNVFVSGDATSFRSYVDKTLSKPQNFGLAIAVRDELYAAIQNVKSQAVDPTGKGLTQDVVDGFVTELTELMTRISPQCALTENEYGQRRLRLATQKSIESLLAYARSARNKKYDADKALETAKQNKNVTPELENAANKATEEADKAEKNAATQFEIVMKHFIDKNITGLITLQKWLIGKSQDIDYLRGGLAKTYIVAIDAKIKERENQGFTVPNEDYVMKDMEFSMYLARGRNWSTGGLRGIELEHRDTTPMQRNKWRISEKYVRGEELSPEVEKWMSVFVLNRNTLEAKTFYESLTDIYRRLGLTVVDTKNVDLSKDNFFVPIGGSALLDQNLRDKIDALGLGAIFDVRAGGALGGKIMSAIVDGRLEVDSYMGLGAPVKGGAIILKERTKGAGDLDPLIKEFIAMYRKDPNGFEQMLKATLKAGNHTFWVETTGEAIKGTRPPDVSKFEVRQQEQTPGYRKTGAIDMRRYLVKMYYVGNSLAVEATEFKNLNKQTRADLELKGIPQFNLAGLKVATTATGHAMDYREYAREGVSGFHDLTWNAGVKWNFLSKDYGQGKLKPLGALSVNYESRERYDVFKGAKLSAEAEKIGKNWKFTLGGSRTTTEYEQSKNRMERNMFTAGAYMISKDFSLTAGLGRETNKYPGTATEIHRDNYEVKVDFARLVNIRYANFDNRTQGQWVQNKDHRETWSINVNLSIPL